MKKINFLFVLVIVALTTYAQEGLVSKKGEPILPENGDWAVSIDATPFLEYAGNFIGSHSYNAAPTFNFLSGNQAIIGKYFADINRAYRFGLRLGFGSSSTTTKVSFIPSSFPPRYVDDVSNISGKNIGLTAGMEWRKGKTRLQGFYGVEAGLALSSSATSNTYGNALSISNPTSRLVKSEDGTSFGLGLRGFLGAEYFIFSKIAIGGEFGWGFAYNTTGEGIYETEAWIDGSVRFIDIPIGESSAFGFDSENLNSVFGSAGSIKLTLHF
jgi:hypothetical protein